MEDNKFKDLLKKYQSGLCTEEEEAWLESWYLNLNETSKESVPAVALAEDRRNNWALINARTKYKPRPMWLSLSAAALLLCTLSIGIYFYMIKYHVIGTPKAEVAQEIAPGGNKAFLTLADGRRISLTDVGNGELAEQAGIKITKAADGQLVYTIQEEQEQPNIQTVTYNTIETPRGGQYQILLPDGTKVWLNAASSLKYPTTFIGADKRQVELKGEAYFEVAHNKAQPFLVITPAFKTNGKAHEVEVLGTHFNINAYADEPAIITTLLVGSVKVNDQLLKPGYQSVFENNKIKISEADPEAAVAWKNGDFVFNGQDGETSLRMLSRWYDVEIDDSENLKNLHFGGVVSRSQNLSAVIKMLQATGDLKFKVEGRRIIMIK
ncbi:FecR family protein [Pedobacter psychrodurus]|uniref:FecR family protein n=1 Tax=Pedobacter psychrodurus TaxID=2530456 RepID=UPI00292E5C7B|nr:FecR family protein [Pedobacter psychrodurus]